MESESPFELLQKDFETLMDTTRQISARMRIFQKEHNKSTRKSTRKKSIEDPETPRQKTALENPVVISDELCMFLGFPPKSEHARSEVTRAINVYIKENNLQNPENRKFILLEGCPAADKLRVLLRDPDQPLTFFNIQRFLKPHYPMSAKDKKNLDNVVSALHTVLDEPDVPVVPDVQVVPDACEVEDIKETKQPVKKKVTRRN